MISQLVLVRHGESAGNEAAAAARLAGAEALQVAHRDPDVPLTTVGLEQAAALGKGLGRLLADQRPTAVWSSPYIRAMQTAQLAVAAAGGGLSLRYDERLRDRELGVLDLLTREGVANRFPLEAQRRAWLGKFYHRPPGGESWADVALRVRSFLTDLQGSAVVERAVLIAHDAVVMLVRYVLEGLDEHALLQIGARDPVRNASITVLDRTDEPDWQLTRYNDVSHLVHGGAPVTQHGGEPDVSH